ncbi:exodeoxyribonuclease VII small subunit [Magnetospira sp. QH-2]|uniref:exodeoxyribonuclease VII small subunit n=1 Tax=Magnetospira sp. (strain QH-2) TaxID=1288970 RepID=UPI0003E81BF6|nr:exodeoxyribonuclease VII small subunit [Magnetospira sp. QH-2]CCQ74146.1 Exodeoxyribonuclease small subunit [Magnetospira sp. QH-2]
MTDTDSTMPDDITRLSFEEALAELETIVRTLEEGKGKLDEAIDAYQRGSNLKRHCEAKLSEARIRIDRIVQRPDGSLASEPAELD